VRQGKEKAISIAILAMGGEGGGVLADWILDLAEHAGHIAQTTSVPGVAQRTGATIYYIETIAESAARKSGKDPVFALMPVPGDVDIVLASELMEAGRAVQRGLVTPDRTTLIASTHRVYAIGEKVALGDGIVDHTEFIKAGQAAAKRFIYCDMAQIAEETGSVISSVLFGALAGSHALPFRREDFEESIRRSGVAVEASLRAFAIGYARAERPSGDEPPGPSTVSVEPAVPDPVEESLAEYGGEHRASNEIAAARQAFAQRAAANPAVARLLERVHESIPPAAQDFATEGVKRMLDYQDVAYANLYLDRLLPLVELDGRHGDGSFRLTRETARYLALWMSYEDTIRVADLKTRSARFRRVREEVRVGAEQFVQINEFMHPRLQEICDTLPAPLGRSLLRSGWPRRIVERFANKGRIIRTTSVPGFLLLYTLARMKRWRRATLRYDEENAKITAWLERIQSIAPSDYELAVEVAECQRLVKGYSDTYERGMHNFNAIMSAIDRVRAQGDAARRVRELRDAALADEHGTRLQEALRQYLPA
jgi:indolepyruvate ferredoxin oxidoreductase beta subunit